MMSKSVALSSRRLVHYFSLLLVWIKQFSGNCFSSLVSISCIFGPCNFFGSKLLFRFICEKLKSRYQAFIVCMEVYKNSRPLVHHFSFMPRISEQYSLLVLFSSSIKTYCIYLLGFHTTYRGVFIYHHTMQRNVA